jgi:hypothetical protein
MRTAQRHQPVAPPVLPADGPDRERAFWRLSPAERVAAMRAGELTLAECSRWAARAPHEVPITNGEFDYIAARLE